MFLGKDLDPAFHQNIEEGIRQQIGNNIIFQVVTALAVTFALLTTDLLARVLVYPNVALAFG